MLCPIHGAAAIRSRLGRIDEPHVAPLNDWVRRLRSDPRLPVGAGLTIPWFDPDSGGVDSAVLLLLQDPSQVASFTGFISPDNNDRTARSTTLLCAEADLPRPTRLHWNVYPWWVNVPGGSKRAGVPDSSRARESWPNARRLAACLTGELFSLLPRLRVVAVFGVEATRGFDAILAIDPALTRGIEVVRSKSLSPPGVNSHRAEVLAALRSCAVRVGTTESQGHD